jgi:DnaJ-class molecular chaperone
MPCNEATDLKDKPSLQAQSPTPRCSECEGQGRVLSTRGLIDLNRGRLEWQTCEGCHGTGLAPVNPRGAFAPRARSYCEE